MTQKELQQLFKKHYRYASKLKEGGKAWDREMAQCERYKNLLMTGQFN